MSFNYNGTHSMSILLYSAVSSNGLTQELADKSRNSGTTGSKGAIYHGPKSEVVYIYTVHLYYNRDAVPNIPVFARLRRVLC